MIGGLVYLCHWPYLVLHFAACNSVDAYHIATKEWSSTTDMPTEKSCFGAAVWRNRIYVVGIVRNFIIVDFIW